MEKIFEIASSITNPISLTALFFLILYLLFKGVISKVGQQEGVKGYRLLKQLMKTVALLAIVTLLLVFGFKAYKVYSNVDDIPQLNEINTKLDTTKDQINEKLKSTSETIIKELNKEELTVNFKLEEFTGGNLLIGNNGGKIIIMKNLKIHWNYKACTQFKYPVIANVIAEYRYKVSISEENGTKLIDTKDYKYGAGDIDKFLVDISYTELGVYNVWFTFEYTIFGTDEWFIFNTEKDRIEKCAKLN